MPDFEKTITVEAAKEQVMNYVSKPENMPQYLPTCQKANMLGQDEVHMEVEIKGEHLEDTGYLRTAGNDRLEWGSEDHDYHGEMIFDGDDRRTNLTLHLHINPPPGLDEMMEKTSDGDWPSKIDQSILSALNAIKKQVEGKQVASA